jgi:hypothetical protein
LLRGPEEPGSGLEKLWAHCHRARNVPQGQRGKRATVFFHSSGSDALAINSKSGV